MKIKEIVESTSGKMFSRVLTHETTPEAARQIRARGFAQPRFGQGIFFNAQGLSYSGGGYGGAEVRAQITGPSKGILNLEDDDNLPPDLDEYADGEEIARYARKKGYWAWTDGMQFVVLYSRYIKVL